MILLSGADIVLPDRVAGPATLVIEGGRIIDIATGPVPVDPGAQHVDLHNHYIVPGFVDVHVHGVAGSDTLDGGDAVQRIAAALPQYGVTAFCPTSVACTPAALREMLAAVRASRTSSHAGSARVLPAHLESNFINPEYKGAQPLECLRLPLESERPDGTFTGREILEEIAQARPDVGIVTVAPEVEGVLDLVGELLDAGHRVSLGHSGATYDQALAAIEAGATHATHLFNRMPRIDHRAPGLAGAVLQRDDVVAELICDGVHVHPAMIRVALAAKQPAGIMAITDGTAGSGLPRGSRVSLGGRPITVGDAAYLDDGTLAGSVLTMDRAFARLVSTVGLSLVDAATICSTTPARALRMQGLGVITPGAIADLVVLDRDLQVVQTWIEGTCVWPVAGAA